tara:strand:- start:1529 stop:1765 length:237 start_codon:yes stop_codon:yes gene_type:complete
MNILYALLHDALEDPKGFPRRLFRFIGLKCLVLGYLASLVSALWIDLSIFWLVVFIWAVGLNLAFALKFVRVQFFSWV